MLGIVSSAVYAANIAVSGFGGAVTFLDHYKNSTVVGAKASFEAREGLIMGGSVSYMEVKSKTTAHPAFKAAPVLAHLQYKLPVSLRIKPYVGLRAGLSKLSSPHDSPAFTYGGTAGLMMLVGKDVRFYIEANQDMIQSDGHDLNPLSFVAGIGIAFGGSDDKRPAKRKRRRGARRDMWLNEDGSERSFKPVRKPRRRDPRLLKENR